MNTYSSNNSRRKYKVRLHYTPPVYPRSVPLYPQYIMEGLLPIEITPLVPGYWSCTHVYSGVARDNIAWISNSRDVYTCVNCASYMDSVYAGVYGCVR